MRPVTTYGYPVRNVDHARNVKLITKVASHVVLVISLFPSLSRRCEKREKKYLLLAIRSRRSLTNVTRGKVVPERKLGEGKSSVGITFRGKTADERRKIASSTRHSLRHRRLPPLSSRSRILGIICTSRQCDPIGARFEIAERRCSCASSLPPSRLLGSSEKGVRRDVAKARRVSTDSRNFVGEMWNGTAAMPGP